MPNNRLVALDRCSVALEVTIAGRRRVLKGTGHYESRSEHGPVLRIAVPDAAGDFEVLIRQCDWTGEIRTGEEFSCDYAVQLDASCLCPT